MILFVSVLHDSVSCAQITVFCLKGPVQTDGSNRFTQIGWQKDRARFGLMVGMSQVLQWWLAPAWPPTGLTCHRYDVSQRRLTESWGYRYIVTDLKSVMAPTEKCFVKWWTICSVWVNNVMLANLTLSHSSSSSPPSNKLGQWCFLSVFTLPLFFLPLPVPPSLLPLLSFPHLCFFSPQCFFFIIHCRTGRPGISCPFWSCHSIYL